jgi:hypothetical protein
MAAAPPAGLGILYYDQANFRFIKTTEALNPGITDITHWVMSLIKAGDCSKDANEPGQRGLYANQQVLTNFIFNIFNITPPPPPPTPLNPNHIPREITSLGTAHNYVAGLENNIFRMFTTSSEEFGEYMELQNPYFWDCGKKGSGQFMINAATELDPHIAGPGTRVDTDLIINNDELYLIGLALNQGGVDGIRIDETHGGIYNFLQYSVCNTNILGIAGNITTLRNMFSTSENSHKNQYIKQIINEPFTPAEGIHPSSIAPDATSIPLKIKFLTKEMGDTFQVISLNKCLTTTYAGAIGNPQLCALYTCDKGTLLSAIQLKVPCYAKIGNENYIYKGYVELTSGDITTIANNYIDTALLIVNNGINFVLNLINTHFSNNLSHIQISGKEYMFIPANNRQTCLNYYRLCMYKLLYCYKFLKRSIIANRDNIVNLITGVRYLETLINAAPDGDLKEAYRDDKDLLINFIKDYYLNQVIKSCFTCNLIGGTKSTRQLEINFRLIRGTLDNRLEILDRYAAVNPPSFTPNIDAIRLLPAYNGIPDPNIMHYWARPVYDINSYRLSSFTKLCERRDHILIDHTIHSGHCILLTHTSCGINNTTRIVLNIEEYMNPTVHNPAGIGNTLYQGITAALADQPDSYPCIPLNTPAHPSHPGNLLLYGGGIKLLKKKTLKKKTLKRKIKGGARSKPASSRHRNNGRIQPITPRTKKSTVGASNKDKRAIESAASQLNPIDIADLIRMTEIEKQLEPYSYILDLVNQTFNPQVLFICKEYLVKYITLMRAFNMCSEIQINTIKLLMVYLTNPEFKMFIPKSSFYLQSNFSLIDESDVHELTMLLRLEGIENPELERQRQVFNITMFDVLKLNESVYNEYYDLVKSYINGSYDNFYLINLHIYSLYILFRLCYLSNINFLLTRHFYSRLIDNIHLETLQFFFQRYDPGQGPGTPYVIAGLYQQIQIIVRGIFTPEQYNIFMSNQIVIPPDILENINSLPNPDPTEFLGNNFIEPTGIPQMPKYLDVFIFCVQQLYLGKNILQISEEFYHIATSQNNLDIEGGWTPDYSFNFNFNAHP